MKARNIIIPGAIFFAATSISGTAFAEETSTNTTTECVYVKTFEYTQDNTTSQFCFVIPENNTTELPELQQLITLNDDFDVDAYAKEKALDETTTQILHLLQDDKGVLLSAEEFINITQTYDNLNEENVQILNMDKLPWESIVSVDDGTTTEDYLTTKETVGEEPVVNESFSTEETGTAVEENVPTEGTQQLMFSRAYVAPNTSTINASEVPSTIADTTVKTETLPTATLAETMPAETVAEQTSTETQITPVENDDNTTTDDPTTSSVDVYGYSSEYGTGDTTETTTTTETPTTDDSTTLTEEEISTQEAAAAENTSSDNTEATDTDATATDTDTDTDTATVENTKASDISYNTGEPIFQNSTTLVSLVLMILSAIGFTSVRRFRKN